MIREDIKNKLLDKNLEEIFLENRDIDQGNYRVGKVEGEIICWNPNNGKFMDYFFDDIEDDSFSFELAFKTFGKEYRYNRKTNKVTGPHGELTIFNQSDNKYPSVHIKKFNSSYNCPIHRLLALLFIPKYDPTFNIVDHIDRNRENFELNNLRWVNIKLNNLNVDRKDYFGNNKYTAFKDKERTVVEFEFSEKDLYEKYKNIDQRAKSKIRNSIFRNIKYDKLYWNIENLDITEYLNGETVDNSLWVEHYSKKFFVHPLGIIKINNKSAIPYLTIGCLKGCENYSIRCFHGIGVHRLIAEVFLNNNSPLDSKLVIDHLDANPLNNRVSNLKICSQSDNMNNPNNKNKNNRLQKIEIDGKTYESYIEASNKLKIRRSVIRHRVLSDKYTNYKKIN